ncbi:MAG: DNA mismatch repair protein MutS, partial [Deltaproteobacteria bacterium]|nr:DNA mismatch repair protein MutS [Deltaproteobacteria bacterium]MBN2670528.1 DNA mismatch repair protein MutS [Deltaproteobacteria bacterium]
MAKAARKPKSTKDASDTPMMRQYMSIKDQYPEAIVMYRMGDFYEMFFEDAVIAAEALDLTLTSRNKNAPDPIPMCGIPHHASIGYVSRLIEQGFKVAVCEQMEDPSKVKGLVKREVVRVITPGVILDEENLDSKTNNYLAAVLPLSEPEGDNTLYALACMDASTNEFKGTQILGAGALTGELFRLEPRELLVPASVENEFSKIKTVLPACFVSAIEDSLFDTDTGVTALNEVIGETDTAELFRDASLLGRAAGAVISYIRTTRPKEGLPRTAFTQYNIADHMVIDEATKSHLELVQTSDGNKRGSLLWLLDATRTAMGARMLRQWINYPLFEAGAIRRRLSRVSLFFEDATFRQDTVEALSGIADIERIAARIGMNAATPRDIGVLRNSLFEVPGLDDLLTSCPSPDAEDILGGPLDRAEDLCAALQAALVDEPPVSSTDAGIFKPGYNTALDDLVETVSSAKDFIAALEARERKRTGINSLKVSYNKVFGYFILVTKSNLKNVPDNYIRKQTLVNGERFITEELEEWESKVLTADEKRKSLEKDLFERLIEQLRAHIPRLLSLSARVAALDCAAALAHVARKYDYAMPHINDKGLIHIVDGRHPLVETMFSEVPFVPNDVQLDVDGERLMIITGPNMAGKSTVMRQVALITVMAQMGSFVPAKAADISLTDRLFTRVGASDNIAKGASTFMVEMNETSTILRSATRDSLVILDEVGRGTSTFDGLSIAWSVGEYLHDAVKCKTMFATHYHELVELANLKSNAANYHVAAREYGEEVVFLRKLVEGGTSHSFGIQVAKMAGLPELVVQRARDILTSLEQEEPKTPTGKVPKQATHAP